MVALADAEAITAARQRFALDAETPTLLIASTSAPEEGPLIEAWQQALPGWRLVLCPRHPERGSHLADLLGERGLSCWRSSIETEPPSKEAVILVDEIGQLAALYAIASIACVGGSFGSGRHGQNMFEPAAVGTPTIVGMDTSNFPDVMAQLRAHQGIIESETSNIAAVLADLAADQNKRQELGENGQRAWQASRGSARRTLRHLLPELTGSQSR
jgi:3-deoxy-D-manno-octulosonic-acid transferase